MNKEECCPKFEPKPWDGKIFEWKNKKFIKDKVFTIFYMPMNFGKVIVRLNEKGICLANLEKAYTPPRKNKTTKSTISNIWEIQQTTMVWRKMH